MISLLKQFSRGCRSDRAKCIELDLERKKIAMNSISPLLETLSVHMCSTVCGDEDSVSTWSDLLGYSINIFAGFLNLLRNFFGGSCAGTCQPCLQLFNQLFYISLKSYMLHEHALLKSTAALHQQQLREHLIDEEQVAQWIRSRDLAPSSGPAAP